MTFKKLILAGALIAAPFVMASPAEAREYCREYQKSIRVGGQIQSGYGTACMQPDGSWMITESSGTVDPFDDLRRDNVVLISDARPVYYDYGPRFQPVTYYPRQNYYRPAYTGSSFFFSFGDNDRWDRRDRWDRNDRWDRDWDRHKNNRGNGHHKGHGNGHH